LWRVVTTLHNSLHDFLSHIQLFTSVDTLAKFIYTLFPQVRSTIFSASIVDTLTKFIYKRFPQDWSTMLRSRNLGAFLGFAMQSMAILVAVHVVKTLAQFCCLFFADFSPGPVGRAKRTTLWGTPATAALFDGIATIKGTW
jgi:hypothetical protein